MKKLNVCVATFSLLLFASCSLFGGSESADSMCDTAVPNDDAKVVMDSVVMRLEKPMVDDGEFHTLDRWSLEARIVFPDRKRCPELANSVLEWLRENSLDDYQGDAMDVKGMVAANMGEEVPFEREVKLLPIYEDDSLITFGMSWWCYYDGGAHGGGVYAGGTFRKRDGRRYGWDMLKGRRIPNDMVCKGLKRYFEVSTDEELKEHLMLDDGYSLKRLPMCQTDPWLEADGMHFQYQSYEIAPYCEGQPCFVVPIADLEWLMVEGV